jgi:hypothetical protein
MGPQKNAPKPVVGRGGPRRSSAKSGPLRGLAGTSAMLARSVLLLILCGSCASASDPPLNQVSRTAPLSQAIYSFVTPLLENIVMYSPYHDATYPLEVRIVASDLRGGCVSGGLNHTEVATAGSDRPQQLQPPPDYYLPHCLFVDSFSLRCPTSGEELYLVDLGPTQNSSNLAYARLWFLWPLYQICKMCLEYTLERAVLSIACALAFLWMFQVPPSLCLRSRPTSGARHSVIMLFSTPLLQACPSHLPQHTISLLVPMHALASAA